jgi:hypothetical protein
MNNGEDVTTWSNVPSGEYRLIFSDDKDGYYLDCSSTAMNSDGQFDIGSTRLEHYLNKQTG